MDSTQEDVTYEKCEERLGTFNFWPKESPALIKELVDAGFFYSGKSDLVRCFACGVQIGQWHEGDNPLEKHEHENEHCRYLEERAIRKAELQILHSEGDTSFEISNDVVECDDNNLENVENRKLSIEKMGVNLPGERIQAIADAGIFYNKFSNEFECYSCHTQFDVPELLESDDPVACHKNKYLPCEHIAIVTGDQEYNVTIVPAKPDSPSPEASSSQNDNRPIGFYQPSDSLLHNESSERLNKVGIRPRQNKQENKLKLTMPNNVNRVQATSGNHISTVENQGSNYEAYGYASAIPHQAAHPKYFDRQPGSASPDLSGNNSPAFKMSPRISMGAEAVPFGHQFSRQLSNWSMSSDDEITNLELQPYSPMQLASKKTMLKTKYGRLQTFLTWPTDAKIQPQELSEAGFYYMGEDDGVKCYKCGILLRNWEIGDDAWTEHKRWSGSCPLVIEHDAQATRNNRQLNNSENRQPMRRQLDRMQHNFYDMRSQIPLDVQFPVSMSSPLLWQFDSRYLEPTDIPRNVSLMGYGDTFHTPYAPTNSQMLGEQRELAGNEQSSIYDNRNVKEPQEVERLGPLVRDDFKKLLDAGFSVETINNVQKMAHEKYGEYLDSIETVADAIVHFLENGNLNEHSLPKEGTSNEQSNTKSSKHLDLKRELDKVREMQLCKICMDEQVGAAFHPCGHLFTCPRCAEGLEQCPVCRAHIESTSRVYLS